MRQIVKWGVRAEMSGRIYHRGCIKLPDLDLPVDIMLINENKEYKVIGESYLIENERGIFIKEVKWYIDIDYLDKLLNEGELSVMSKESGRYDPDLCIALMGRDENEYKEKDQVEFKFLIKTILSNEPIETIIRDIKLNTLEQ